MEKEGVSHAATYWGLNQANEKAMRAILRNAAKQGDAFDKAMAGGMLLTRSDDQQLKQEGEQKHQHLTRQLTSRSKSSSAPVGRKPPSSQWGLDQLTATSILWRNSHGNTERERE